MPTVAFKTGTPVFKGTYKIANRATITNNEDDVYKIRQPRGSYKDFIIVKFEKGNPQDIYAELELYYEFGQKGISPRIHFVKLPFLFYLELILI